MAEPVMYILVNKSLKMSPGKLAAQCSHAAIKAYLLSDTLMQKKWDEGSFTKIILGAKNKEQLSLARGRLLIHNINSFTVVDEGRTEIEPGQETALGVEILDKDKVAPLLRDFSLY